MIRRLYHALPGSTPLRAVQMGLIVVLLAVVLLLAYEWAGTTFLDPGGAVG